MVNPLLEAAQFYKAHLDDVQKRQDSATVAKVAALWYADKESGKTKKLRDDTLRGIFDAKEILEWPQDVLRHSYGSYWLAKHKNRAQLAENMGNSVQIIKKHYKQVVSNSAVKEYWKIVPGYNGQGAPVEILSNEDIKKTRARRIAEVVNREVKQDV